MKKPAPIKLLAHFFTVVILVACLSCEDYNILKQIVDPPTKVLPPATHIGANTFGCKVNGKVWLPSKTPFIEFRQGALDIIARNEWDKNTAVVLNIGDFTISGTDTYQISGNTPYYSRGYYSRENKTGGYDRFQTDDINTGTIIITRIDTTQLYYIVSGVFNFKARDEITGEIIEITEGRFDLRKY